MFATYLAQIPPVYERCTKRNFAVVAETAQGGGGGGYANENGVDDRQVPENSEVGDGACDGQVPTQLSSSNLC